MGPKFAVVSIGTNSTRLLVVQADDAGVLQSIEQRSIGTRLGENLREAGPLEPQAVARTLAVIDEYATIIEDQQAQASAIATSAMRRASDGVTFAQEVEKRIGAPLEIIPGDREAELSFRGVVASHPTTGRIGVLDVGGGSTEFACGQEKVEARQSCEIGAVRLSEAIPELLGKKVPGNVPALEEKARAYAAERLAPLRDLPRVSTVFAVGGTAFNAAAVLADTDRDSLDGAILSRTGLTDVARRFLALDTKGRRNQPRISAQRADIFPAGLLIVDEALAIAGVDHCTLSRGDLLYGYLVERYAGGAGSKGQ